MSKREKMYIEKVLAYTDNYEAIGGNNCPPVIPELLLSIFIRLGDILMMLGTLVGLVLLAIVVL